MKPKGLMFQNSRLSLTFIKNPWSSSLKQVGSRNFFFFFFFYTFFCGDSMVSLHEVCGIFSSIEVIAFKSLENFQRLSQILDTWNSNMSVLSDIFTKLSLLELYKTYCSNYGRVHELLLKLKAREPKFKEFISKAERDPRCGEDLESSLIRVVQRIPQYNMLLSDIVANTWFDHPDYDGLFSALKRMQQVGVQINEAIREHESKNRVGEIESQLIGLSVRISSVIRNFHFFSVPPPLSPFLPSTNQPQNTHHSTDHYLLFLRTSNSVLVRTQKVFLKNTG
eukprot:TRINITY_DN7733_c0_g2_i3.p1 TRINITY_DN7733_c0_g2~~TRINITY_DN7733_c0_g2_i3.p1  ORF type:complete len:280 (-),score=41.79 TRINITY_DN7733_c0_g2_i3:317-1156(-)